MVVAARPESTARSAARTLRAPAEAGTPRGVRTVARRPDAKDAAGTYDREIQALSRILSERRTQLNPATVDVLEKNLHIIDRAIRESRAALARDPASDFLNQQLNKALEKKVELLRTAALLPAT
jgi:hypothetical protein